MVSDEFAMFRTRNPSKMSTSSAFQDLVMRYIGRRAAASPATGYPKLHNAEQEALIREALLGTSDARAEDNYSVQRPSPLLGHQT